jgi:hypothetical protein
MRANIEYKMDALDIMMLDLSLQQTKRLLAFYRDEQRAMTPEQCRQKECIFWIEPKNQDDCVIHDLKHQTNKRWSTNSFMYFPLKPILYLPEEPIVRED